MGAVQSTGKTQALILASLFFVLAGCETPPSALEQNFGSSVRNAIVLQTAPPAQPVPGTDGVKSEAVLRAYQGDVVKPGQETGDLIQINLGK